MVSFKPAWSERNTLHLAVSLFHSYLHTCEISANWHSSFKQNTLAALLSEEDVAGNCYFHPLWFHLNFINNHSHERTVCPNLPTRYRDYNLF